MTTSEYLLDNRAAAAQRRFGALSALFDDVTFRHVEALGIQRGWRCWEAGRRPSVPNWLAGRTGGPRPGDRHRYRLDRRRGTPRRGTAA